MKFLLSYNVLNNLHVYKKVCCFYVLLFCFTTASFAQSTNGKITGKVIDATTNETLIGVSVKAVGTAFGAVTGVDGSYILTLPAGTYTITYNYLGYQAKEISGIVVRAGQSTFQNIVLAASSKGLKEVVIKTTAKKESQSSVYAAQKRSSAVSDGISQEAIRRTPDNNAAQVLTRVTGVNVQDNKFVVVRGLADQYNQTMLNGVQMTSTETDRNAFAFDLIPASAVDNIVVNKTATPDMPGNFAGGVVQVNTKDFPDNKFFSVSLQSGYSDGTYGKDFYSDKRSSLEWLGFGGSSRNLPKDFPTSTSRIPFLYLPAEEVYRHVRTLKNNLVPINNGPSKPNEQIQLGFGQSFKLKNDRKLGIILALNQRKTELIEQEITARGPTFNNTIIPPATRNVVGLDSYSEQTRYNYSSNFGAVLNLAYGFGNNKITLKNLYTTVFRNSYLDRPSILFPEFLRSIVKPSPFITGLSYLTEQRSILNSTLGGEHRTGANNTTRLDWNINATLNKANAPDAKNFQFWRDSLNLYGTMVDPSSPTEALATFSRSWSGNTDFIYGGAFNTTTPFKIGRSKHLFKGGVLFQNRRRNVEGTILPINGMAADNARTTLDSILNPERIQPDKTAIVIALSGPVQDVQNYIAGSSLLAMYESVENNIGDKLRVIWGVRVENYQQNVNVYRASFNDYFKEPDLESNFFASRTTFNLLPSLNIVYNPISPLNIRAAYSNTVIRPELKDIAPFSRFDFQTLAITSGNQTLKSTAIANYDLKLEWFPSSGEIFSIGAFYKKLKNPIEYIQDAEDRIPRRTSLNTGNAYVKGIEAELRKKIDFIPFAPWLSHLTCFGNGTLLKSKVSSINYIDFETTSTKFSAEHTLSGQANYIVNAGISLLLLKNTFETTLSFNKTGDYINVLGSSDLVVKTESGTFIPTVPHHRVSSRDLVDLVASKYILKRKGQFRFKASNLLNKPFILYQDLNGNNKFDAPVNVHKIPKISIANQIEVDTGVDNTRSFIKAQRTYSISFAYTF
ncbi:MAG: carboxypeptidase-like regulatory domain-containing protein [Pyrinomonadaceae bacterium]|nr:carboxypeptidase-like regulatory domain-containing protein [Sphingobacteriaceae bacterium]